MKVNAAWNHFYSLLLMVGISFSTLPVWSQDQGKGGEVVAITCTQCHGLDYLAKAKGLYSAAEWENIVYDMIARGAPVQEKDLDEVVKYLIDGFAKK